MKNGIEINIGDYYFTLLNWHIILIILIIAIITFLVIKKIRKHKIK